MISRSSQFQLGAKSHDLCLLTCSLQTAKYLSKRSLETSLYYVQASSLKICCTLNAETEH